MADIIQRLPDHVANQIAAGEVVQRPASVVKELLENAIDAKATQIKLVIKQAGKALIQVIDNGVGMSDKDAELCFERHATSKLQTAQDLFALATKGFRGEALASIAAIAHVELHTKQADALTGIQLKIEAGELISNTPMVTPTGSAILVKNLFYNIPARRNFLKSDAVELRHIIDEFHRVVLSHPDIHFDMYHNDSELFHLPASSLKQRIVRVFGSKTNEKIVPVEEETEVVKISGYIGKPAFAKKGKSEQFFFVNGRFIKNGYLHHAVLSAFEGLIKEGTQPSYFIYLEVDPASIDINIHPTKTEIKFDDEHTLYAILRSTVKHSLGQFNISPVLDFEKDTELETPYAYKNKPVAMPTIEVDPNFNPFTSIPEKEDTTQKTPGFLDAKPASKKMAYKKPVSDNWDSLYVGLESKTNTKNTEQTDFSRVEYESTAVTGSLFTEDKALLSGHATYQLHKKYIVTTIKSGMVIIDQSRAHQRVLYEQFLENITVKEAISQQLLFPLTLHFTPVEIQVLEEIKESLSYIGLAFSTIDKQTIEVTGVPVHVSGNDIQEFLEQLMADFQKEIPESSFSQTDLLAKTLSRSLAVKAGQVLDGLSQETLVNNLFACKEPSKSPFLKPTFVTMSVEELDKKFM